MHIRTVLVVVFAVAVSGALFAAGAPEAPSTVTVVGEGEVVAEPDQAAVDLGVQLYDESAQAAAAELAERMTAVIAAIRDLGVPERRIRTMNYRIFFERDYQRPPTERTQDGRPAGVYRVENTVRVVIDDVDNAASVVEAAIQAGANQMYGINFSFSDPDALDAEARTLAVEDARSRAEALATASGRSVGNVIEITEVAEVGPGYAEARSMAAGMGGGPVQPGSARYTARVQVTYELK